MLLNSPMKAYLAETVDKMHYNTHDTHVQGPPGEPQSNFGSALAYACVCGESPQEWWLDRGKHSCKVKRTGVLLSLHSAGRQGVEAANMIMRMLSVIFLASCAFCVQASDRALKVTIKPVNAPITRPFDPRLRLNSSDIPPSDPRVQKAGAGCNTPEQVDQQCVCDHS